jgi:methylated-DNA-[protein]-cysteine S-methyltransferase
MAIVTSRSLGYLLFDTAIGCCGLAWGVNGLTGVLLPEEGGPAATRRRMARLHALSEEAEFDAPPLARSAAARIQGLLQGEKDDLLDLPLDTSGLPEFHRRVYEAVRRIGPGHTATYGEIAALLAEPGAARAVGQAMARNPFAPVVPCHRSWRLRGPPAPTERAASPRAAA